MSSLFRLLVSQNNSSILRANLSQTCVISSGARYFSVSALKLCNATTTPTSGATDASTPSIKIDIDRTKIIPVEQSLRYLASEAYKETYGDKLVWEQYRRNHKGSFAPRKTRKTCVRKGMISTGNPCPICRDEFLVLDHRNLELLQQFISPQTGEILSYSKTGLCQKKHQQLVIAIERAMDYGLITFDVPFRKYDYSEYYDPALLKASN